MSNRNNRSWKKGIELKVEYHNLPTPLPYHDFLNEARLSALALCMYFASLSIIPEPQHMKILFLDDVFIGLDMRNRLPLLEILTKFPKKLCYSKKFNRYKAYISKGGQKNYFFADYQIFMTTYDRHWFEVAKSNLGGGWKCIEMYVSKKNGFDVPVVLDDNENYVAKATKYFELYDYPATGNYLRKECERLLKLILSKKPSYLISNDGKPINTLESLINQLVKYHTDNNIKLADNLDRSLRTYKDAILNPASHDDLKSNLYKKEIENTFEFVKILSTFELPNRKLFLESGAYLRYYNPTFMYEILLLVSDNIYYDGIRKDVLYQVLLKKKSFKVCWWKYKGAYFYDKEKGDDVKIVEIMVIERTLESVKTIIFNHALELEKDSTQIPRDKYFIDSLTIESKNTSGATLQSLIEALSFGG